MVFDYFTTSDVAKTKTFAHAYETATLNNTRTHGTVANDDDDDDGGGGGGGGGGG